VTRPANLPTSVTLLPTSDPPDMEIESPGTSKSSGVRTGHTPSAARAALLWDSIVRYKTERGALGSKTGYPRLGIIGGDETGVFPSAFHSASNLGSGTHLHSIRPAIWVLDWGVPICIPFGQQFGFWYPSAFHSASNLGTGLGCSHLHSIRPAIWVLVPICIPFGQQFGYWRLGCSHQQFGSWYPSAFHSASNFRA
jgi:hypothetical protein